ncbi:serine/arginine-rich splicing factor 7-like [Limanda limanda]|uniref:serine/arginine-rich splicing factor 7-like n=1 Tax=Limanda limanda TaxID=27771 RepID=UPI0029C777E7|nr:serine/arginine-rich splicing factor 7-like [Limanda limanda]
MSHHSRSSSRTGDCKVYVGDLGNGAAKGELERAFSYYGPLRSVWVARNPPGFAFVEFEDPRDAEDAVKGMDGKLLCGSRVRVELSTGLFRKGRGRPSRRQFDPADRCYQCGDRGHYAYDCYRFSKRGRRSRSRSHSRSCSRSRSRGHRYRTNTHSNRRYPSITRRRNRSGSPARAESRIPVRR